MAHLIVAAHNADRTFDRISMHTFEDTAEGFEGASASLRLGGFHTARFVTVARVSDDGSVEALPYWPTTGHDEPDYSGSYCPPEALA